MPKATLAVIIGNRDFFPVTSVKSGYHAPASIIGTTEDASKGPP